MTAGGSSGDHRGRLAAWQEHLRAGGATPWREFAGAGLQPGARPGSAVHLELIRRLDSNLPDFASLADLVLATATPGRGRVDVPVMGDPSPRVGAPAVDPARVDVEELLRLATAVLAPLVLAAPPAPSRPAPRGQWFARRFRVWGPPVARRQLRDALLARGWRETPSGGTTFVLGSPVNDGVAQVWAQRVERGGMVTWPRLWRRFEARDRLPSSLDHRTLLATARALGGRVESMEGTTGELADQARARLGLDLDGAPDLVAVDLTRRLNAVLTTRVPDRDRPALAPRVASVVGVSADPVTSLAVPAGRLAWALRQPGPPADYAQHAGRGPQTVPADRVLELALAAIGRGWTVQRGGY